MVNAKWMEDKLIQLENDRNKNYWTDIRENQLNYLFDIYKTGKYEKFTKKEIFDNLAILLNY